MDAEPHGGNAYKRPAYAITELFKEVNAAFPGRSKKSDGILGDQAHAQRASGHNPNSKGIVCAGDITHDPKHCDGTVVSATLRAGRDNRLLYVIWDHHIFDGPTGTEPFTWRPYDGADPHTGHVHVSLRQDARYYDNDKIPWGFEDMPTADEIANAMLDAPIRSPKNDPYVKPGKTRPLREHLEAELFQLNAIREVVTQIRHGDK